MKKYVLEFLSGFLEFAACGELVSSLQPLDEGVEFHTNCRKTIAGASFFPLSQNDNIKTKLKYYRIVTLIKLTSFYEGRQT
jgi:hypothetical protein